MRGTRRRRRSRERAGRRSRRTRLEERSRSALPGGGALFFFDEPLAVDAVAGEGQRFEALVGDGLPAPLAVTKVASVDLLQRGDDLFQDSTVTVAELEEELPVVGRRSLIAEILRGVVVGTLGVEHGLAHFFGELAMLLLQLFLELGQSVLPHRCLLRDTAVPGRIQARRLPRSSAKINRRRPLPAPRTGAARRPTGARVRKSGALLRRRRAR